MYLESHDIPESVLSHNCGSDIDNSEAEGLAVEGEEDAAERGHREDAVVAPKTGVSLEPIAPINIIFQ